MHCSGDIYAGVPIIVPVWVRVIMVPPRKLAIPKSKTLTRRPSGVSSTAILAGLMSR